MTPINPPPAVWSLTVVDPLQIIPHVLVDSTGDWWTQVRTRRVGMPPHYRLIDAPEGYFGQPDTQLGVKLRYGISLAYRITHNALATRQGIHGLCALWAPADHNDSPCSFCDAIWMAHRIPACPNCLESHD